MISAAQRCQHKISNKGARNTQSGTCEGSHLAHSQSRPFDAALMLFCSLQLAQEARTSTKRNETNSALSHFALSHSCFLSALPPAPPPPVRKKFCVYLCISDYSTHRRLHRFEEAAWFTRNGKSQHVVGLAGQGVYLTWGCLVQGFGHSPWEPGPASARALTLDFRIGRGNLPTQKPATYKPRKAHP